MPYIYLFRGWEVSVLKEKIRLAKKFLKIIYSRICPSWVNWIVMWNRNDLRSKALWWNNITKYTCSYTVSVPKIRILIKPPLQQNLNKPPLFWPKSPLFEAFWGKNQKKFNKPPPKNPQTSINCWQSIGVDTVIIFLNKHYYLLIKLILPKLILVAKSS